MLYDRSIGDEFDGTANMILSRREVLGNSEVLGILQPPPFYQAPPYVRIPPLFILYSQPPPQEIRPSTASPPL